MSKNVIRICEQEGRELVKGLILKRIIYKFKRERNTNPHLGGDVNTCEELEVLRTRQYVA